MIWLRIDCPELCARRVSLCYDLFCNQVRWMRACRAIPTTRSHKVLTDDNLLALPSQIHSQSVKLWTESKVTTYIQSLEIPLLAGRRVFLFCCFAI